MDWAHLVCDQLATITKYIIANEDDKINYGCVS